MNVYRRLAHAIVWFPPEVEARVRELAHLQSSAVRCAYQAIHKKNLKNNNLKQHVKIHYMAGLNQRYIADACLLASEITQKHALFGGRRAWRDYTTGKITKTDWQTRRDGQLYSRGDKTKRGNPNLRLDGDRLFVNDPNHRGRWLEGRIWWPRKFQGTVDPTCYDVRLIFRDGKIELKISWEEAAPEIKTTTAHGILSLDVNPDGVALVETTTDGNLQRHRYIRKQRLPFARQNKRQYDVRLLAKEIVAEAEATGKSLILEDLKFSRKNKGRKFNRMASNFVHRQIVEAAERRATKRGVEVRRVNPAFTSVLGRLKYEKPYSLNRHTAAALVIGRRGMNLFERQTFTVTPSTVKKDTLNLAGRGASTALSYKAWSWLQDRFLRSNPVDLTGPPLVPPRGIRGSAGGIPAGEPVPITGRYGVEHLYSAGERTAFGTERSVRVS